MKRSPAAVDRPPKRLYSLKEAGMYLGRTEWAMRHLVNSGRVPYVRIDSRIQFDIHDLDRVIDQNKRCLEE
jgi:hypothetical protein